MRKIVILAIVLLLMMQVSASTRRALVIGIGKYPVSSGWAVINGDKDIPIVVEMLTINGYQRENIATLCNEQATKRQIKASIRHLAEISQPGDRVYIHFSGHGQQVVDVHGDETDDDNDNMDEAWIPYDAQARYVEGKYEGENHILDDELYNWFSAIKKKIGSKGHLTVSVDACHSAGSTRGAAAEDSVCIRGELADGSRGLDAVFKAVRSWFSQDETPVPGNKRKLKWTVISACKSRQCNREYRGRGSLTTALREMAEQLGSMTGTQVRTKVLQWMNANLGSGVQQPIIESEKENSSFF